MRDKSFSTDNEIIPTDISIAGSDPNNLSGRYFILWDIVDPRTESNPNPDPNCGFTLSHKTKYFANKYKKNNLLKICNVAIWRQHQMF